MGNAVLDLLKFQQRRPERFLAEVPGTLLLAALMLVKEEVPSLVLSRSA